jgi:hypothetical protein
MAGLDPAIYVLLCFGSREDVMAHDEILWLASIPVICPECGHKTPQTIAGLMARDSLVCTSCGYSISLKSESWRNFVRQIAERLSGLTIPSTKGDGG